MKIVQFASSSSWTGELAHVFSLTRTLLAKGLEVTLAIRTVRKGKRVQLVRQKAAEYGFPRILELRMDSGFYPVHTIKDVCKLRRFIDSEGIDVLHCHRGQDHWLAMLTVPLCKKRPIVVRTRHVTVPIHPHALNKWLFGRTDLILATGRSILHRFENLPFRLKRPVRLLHGGVDCNEFFPGRPSAGIRTHYGLADEDCLISAVGHLAPVKGYKHLLDALAIAQKQVPNNLTCLIVGSGSEEQQNMLNEQIRSLGLEENVCLTGFRTDISEIMSESDLGVLSSVGSEGNSRTALELMASALPVIATRVGCLPDLIIDGENGCIVPPADPDALAQKIVELAKNKELRRAMGDRGRERVLEHYCEKKVADEVLAIYRNLMG